MLGLIVIGLTLVMICTLVKNALVGKQLDAEHTYQGTIELIIPITTGSEFYLEPWIRALNHFQKLPGHLKIHILIDGHHPAMTAWQELHQKLPNVELHSFLNRPDAAPAAPWMIQQISPRITGKVVIIGDAELVPTEHAFISLASYVELKGRSFFVLPQTARSNYLGEAIAQLNPTLALASVFGFKKFRKNVSHPMMSIAQGWMGMTLETFKAINFNDNTIHSWKLALARQWEEQGKVFALAFGERHLSRHYPEDFKVQIIQMKGYWNDIWENGDRTGFWLYLVSLGIWAFPVLCFFSHPFWSFASFLLLCLYRFFSKIVFQESWGSIFLHPVSSMVWVATFLWWGITGMKSRYGLRAS